TTTVRPGYGLAIGAGYTFLHTEVLDDGGLGNLFFRDGGLERGDVVIFKSPLGKRFLVKRIVGLPGDVVSIRKGSLYIDGKLSHKIALAEGERSTYPPVKVPPHSFYCLGDNTAVSEDSRYFGCIPEKDIYGRVLLRYFPIDHMGCISTHPPTGLKIIQPEQVNR
ncbi:MAG: signal peptidase I, partial [Acidobacteriota bacterium]